MKKAIIFGCGEIGKITYHILKNMYEIAAWVDNNEKIWGKVKENVKIISPDSMLSLVKDENVDLFVAVVSSDDIVKQLSSYGLSDFYVWKEGCFFFNMGRGCWLSHSSQTVFSLDASSKNVLFVMNTILGGIREYRLAKILRKAGYKIYLAYMMPVIGDIDKGFTDVYADMLPVLSLQDLMNLVENNDFEFVHSSSEPEWATGFLINSGKTIIHECHDLGSSNVFMTPEQMSVEYLSNVGSDGVIYPSEKLRNDAVSKFGIPVNRTLVMENYISETLIPDKVKSKLSRNDGKIHAVYEGAISSGDRYDKRFFEDIWLKIAEDDIHLHFYTNHGEPYCRYLESLHENIHYEGNLSSKELAVEMSEYDLGILMFNVNARNRLYLENASPNKLYEYINAGLPVATCGISTYKEFLRENNVGDEVNMNDNLYAQFKKISEINIPPDFLINNHLTVESNEKRILSFFEECRRKKL